MLVWKRTVDPILTLIALAFGNALTFGAVVGSVVGGVIGNRADAALVGGFNRLFGLLKSSKPDTQQSLQRAIARAVILAKHSIVQDCLKKELTAGDRQWLEEKGKLLKGDLQKVDQMVFAVLDPQDLGRFLVPEGAEVGAVEMLRGQLLQDAAEAPQIYGELARSQLFERVCDRFSAEMQEEPVLRDLLQIQLLAQIRAEMPTAAGLAEALAGSFGTIQQELQEIKDILLPPPPVQVRGQDFPRNPFVPLKGRVDDMSQFFPQPELINQIFELLNAGSSVALIGDRGMGKSSLLKEIQRISMKRLNRQAIYVDWNLVRNEKTFWELICHEIRVPQCVNSELVRTLQSRRLLLLLDDVESRQVFSEEIRYQLRGFAQGDSMKIIVVARASLDSIFPDNGFVSSLSETCTEQRILNWSESMIRAYIANRLDNSGVGFSEIEVQNILTKSYGNPRKLVRECNEIYRAKHILPWI
jgi:hypothetical protein